MKIIFSSVSRLIFSYIKYILAVTMLSTIGTGVNADTNNEATYLKCENKYVRLTGVSFSTNYNVRTKRFLKKYKISAYTENYIKFDGYRLNRNNGEWSYGYGDKKKILRTCKKISFLELPKLNSEGKLF